MNPKVLIPMLLVLSTMMLVAFMKFSAPEAARSVPPPRVARVSVQVVELVDTPAMVRVTGTAEAARQVVVMPEVGGRIVAQSSELVPGGRVAKGDVLVNIDPRDYRLAVEQERSRVRQAELEVQLEQGRGAVAEREWIAVKSADAEGAPLALRVPQMATAERSLTAARAGLSRAELALERATLRAPFNAIIIEESAEVGQVVGAGTRIATLVGTDEIFIRAAVPVERLPFIAIPGMGADAGSRATVIHDLGTTTVEREARVLRLVGTLDPASRTAQVIVGVSSPLDSPEGAPPLLPGAYVEVVIEGRIVNQVLAVPRAAVVDGDRAWIVSDEKTLALRTLDVQWRDPKRLFVRGGLEPGAQVVTSPLALPIEGMSVEVVTP